MKEYGRLTGDYPPRGSVRYRAIEEAIPTTQDCLEKWSQVVKAWLLNGNNQRNVAGMIEWYRNGKSSNGRVRNRIGVDPDFLAAIAATEARYKDDA